MQCAVFNLFYYYKRMKTALFLIEHIGTTEDALKSELQTCLV